MPRPKYLQPVLDFIYGSKTGCVRRYVIVDYLMSRFELTREQARTAAKQALKSLLKSGMIVKRGRGYYCRPG
jgi:hypothetical protein